MADVTAAYTSVGVWGLFHCFLFRIGGRRNSPGNRSCSFPSSLRPGADGSGPETVSPPPPSPLSFLKRWVALTRQWRGRWISVFVLVLPCERAVCSSSVQLSSTNERLPQMHNTPPYADLEPIRSPSKSASQTRPNLHSDAEFPTRQHCL